MSIIFYNALYLFLSIFSADEDVVSYETDSRFARITSYDFRDFQESDKRITWERRKDVVYIESIDENLFDERVTPPLTLYVGKVRPILKNSSFEKATIMHE
jgi:hypothetical protein